MDTADEFNLTGALERWGEQNYFQKNLTPADKEEFKNHILHTIDELQERGLSEEEAFTITSSTMVRKFDNGSKVRQWFESLIIV